MRHDGPRTTWTIAMRILVLGATGFVGRALTPALAQAGETVRAASRRAPAGVLGAAEWVHCDTRDMASLRRALEEMDCAYYLVHSMGKGAGDFRAVERASARNFLRAAEERGVSRLVYLGGPEPSHTPSEHLASRLEVGEVLRGGRVRALELRASMIVGHGSASWKIVRDLSMRLPVMILPRWLESQMSPVALPDVVRALVAARDVPLLTNAWFDLPGPDVLRATEMLMAVGRLTGRKIPAVHVPVLTPKLSALWLRLVSGADYAVASELVAGLRDDLLPRGAHFWERIGDHPQWSFVAAAEEALRAERAEGVARGFAAREEQWVRRMGAALRFRESRGTRPSRRFPGRRAGTSDRAGRRPRTRGRSDL